MMKHSLFTRSSKLRRICTVIAVICVLVLLLAFLQRLLMPKYMSNPIEGTFISEYYNEVKKHDVIFVGDCEVYENISPVKLWEEYGITSYIRGTAQQLVWQSYYILEETLKYETPKVVVFNVLAMMYNEPQREEYNRMTIDGMKLSATKINMINASMTEDESFIEYIFPILRYHSRWSQLKSDDIRYFFSRDIKTFNGYYMRTDVKPMLSEPPYRELTDYTLGDNAYKYIDKMVSLCNNKGIELILIKSPSVFPHWYTQWDEQIRQYADEKGLMYINCLDNIKDIGIDYTTDTYDSGFHLNVYGAEKLSVYLGKILSEEYNVPDRRGQSDIAAIWEDKVNKYYTARNS